MTRSLKLFTLFGTPVRVNYTWPIAPIIITVALGTTINSNYYFADGPLAPYSIAAAVALAIVASILLHELAHVLVARRFGIRASGITLFALGGVSHLDDDDHGRPRTDLAVSIAGPIASLAIGLALGMNSLIPNALIDPADIEYRYVSMAEAAPGPGFFLRLGIEYVAIANIIIGVFNLLPLFPLDGGRILSAILWAITNNRQRGIRIASLVGQLGAAAMIVYGAYNLFFGELLVGVWLIAIGVFLMEAAVGAAPGRAGFPLSRE